jgi:MFS family permease
MGLLIIFAAKEAFWFALALALVGLSASVTYYSSLLYAVRLSAQKGKGTGRHESILSMGALLGPLLGGLAAQATGLRTPYLICFGFLLVAVFLELVLLGRISLAEREIDPNQRP